MSTTNKLAARVVPARAIPGGRVAIEAGSAPFAVEPVPHVRFGAVDVRLASASTRRLVAIVPAEIEGGRAAIELDASDEPVGAVEIGRAVATGLHQVDGPAFDRDGNLYVTFSGTRGQQVPVSIFRVRSDGEREAIASGIVNATSLAFDPFGELCVTSRFDGSVYRVKMDGTVEKVASDLGVACGLAFTPDGTMYVGDRTGTLFRVNAAGRVIPFATLPPSIAAFHLAIGPHEEVYVTAPTLSTRDPIYRVDHRGEVTVFAEGFGRPQGLAVDAEGTLHVAEALAGASGVYRVRRGGRRELIVAGDGVIGLAFHPGRGVAVVSSDTAYLFPGW
jgi:glucose/arabinose dehydrogenase